MSPPIPSILLRFGAWAIVGKPDCYNLRKGIEVRIKREGFRDLVGERGNAGETTETGTTNHCPPLDAADCVVGGAVFIAVGHWLDLGDTPFCL